MVNMQRLFLMMVKRMKILIDIPEELRERLFNIVNYGMDIATGLENVMIMSIVNGTPIPDNATNGDVTKAMFPFYNFEIYEHKGYVMVFYEDFYTTYPLRWWNAPYQKEGDKE